MNDTQREGILSNAKYLRDVRPLDPDEISQYVEGQPHPAVVRRVLREEALALRIVERGDGTFEPVADGPVGTDFDGVTSLPESYERRFHELLADEFGPHWFDGESGDQLRDIIRRQKEDYYRQHPVEYDRIAALGYGIYHLVDYYAVIQYVLDEIGKCGLLGKNLRILDVGAGVGGPTLGMYEYLPEDALVEYHAVEPSDAAFVLEHMLAETGQNFHWSIHELTAEAFCPDDSYDLICFGNVLSELDDPVAVVEKYLEYLSEDGSLVAIAPADLNTATQLRAVERAFSPEYTVFAPTLRLWPGYEPSDRGWSFDVKPDLDVPRFQERLDDGSETFVNVDVQYAYFILRKDGSRRREYRPDARRVAKMVDAEGLVTKRVNLVGVKLSHDLSDAGERPLFKVGDGSERAGHFAVVVNRTSLNEALVHVNYGEIVSFENVLVLWNEDEDAYNLVVDEETFVERVA